MDESGTGVRTHTLAFLGASRSLARADRQDAAVQLLLTGRALLLGSLGFSTTVWLLKGQVVHATLLTR